MIEFLGMDEADASNVVWSGQANDESVLALVKYHAEDAEYTVSWFTAHEWARVDGTEQQWMFEYDPSESFELYADEAAAIEAAKATLTEHCGKEWS